MKQAIARQSDIFLLSRISGMPCWRSARSAARVAVSMACRLADEAGCSPAPLLGRISRRTGRHPFQTVKNEPRRISCHAQISSDAARVMRIAPTTEMAVALIAPGDDTLG